MKDTILEKLKKLKSFIDSEGNENEQRVAKSMLYSLLEKNGMTINDLKNPGERKKYKFKYTYVEEKSLIVQIIAALTDDPELEYSWYKNKKKEIFVEMLDWQYKEAMSQIDFHVSQFRKERKAKLKALKIAYISKHRIFPQTPRNSENGKNDLTPEEMAEILRSMDSLEDVSYQKRLEA